jgi:hypothetical protein
LKGYQVFWELDLPLFVVQLVFGTKNCQQHHDMLLILHNMIIEDERDLNLKFFYDNVVAEWNHKGLPITFKHFLRYISKLKTQPHISS